MAKHSISEASRLTGKARSTIHRHLTSGKISKEVGEDGSPVIDTSELVRVYGALQSGQDSETVSIGQPTTPEKDTRNSTLWVEVETLRREKIDKLESDLEAALKERDDWKAQAQRALSLLTHGGTPPAEQPAATPRTAPESLRQRVGRWIAGE